MEETPLSEGWGRVRQGGSDLGHFSYVDTVYTPHPVVLGVVHAHKWLNPLMFLSGHVYIIAAPLQLCMLTDTWVSWNMLSSRPMFSF